MKNKFQNRFANNRTSGLVLDCGAYHTSAIPIHDGYVLNKAVVQTPMGGDFIMSKCRQLLEDQSNIEIVPYYQVKSKVNYFWSPNSFEWSKSSIILLLVNLKKK